MGKRAMAGMCLQALIKMAVPLLREAERQCPRTGPGAQPDIPDWFIGLLILIAIFKRKKSKSAHFRFVTDEPDGVFSARRTAVAASTGGKRRLHRRVMSNTGGDFSDESN